MCRDSVGLGIMAYEIAAIVAAVAALHVAATATATTALVMAISLHGFHCF